MRSGFTDAANRPHPNLPDLAGRRWSPTTRSLEEYENGACDGRRSDCDSAWSAGEELRCNNSYFANNEASETWVETSRHFKHRSRASWSNYLHYRTHVDSPTNMSLALWRSMGCYSSIRSPARAIHDGSFVRAQI